MGDNPTSFKDHPLKTVEPAHNPTSKIDKLKYNSKGKQTLTHPYTNLVNIKVFWYGKFTVYMIRYLTFYTRSGH